MDEREPVAGLMRPADLVAVAMLDRFAAELSGRSLNDWRHVDVRSRIEWRKRALEILHESLNFMREEI